MATLHKVTLIPVIDEEIEDEYVIDLPGPDEDDMEDDYQTEPMLPMWIQRFFRHVVGPYSLLTEKPDCPQCGSVLYVDTHDVFCPDCYFEYCC